jgi:hypothetical protein
MRVCLRRLSGKARQVRRSSVCSSSCSVILGWLPRHRSGGNLKGIRDALIGPVAGSISVGFVEDAPVKQHSGVRPAAMDERLEMAALLFGETDDVFCTWREPPCS